MKRLLLGILATAVLALPVFAALKPGDQAPDFSARASLAGKEFDFSLKEALNKGPVVVYFYPSAFTGGCNIQARTFAVNKDKFDAAGASIIGVSQDSIARLNAFSADPEYCGGKVAVASDPSGKIASAYGLATLNRRAGMKDTRGEEVDHELTERMTFVVTRGNRVAATFSSTADKITPAEHVEKSLAAVQQLAGK